MSSQERATYWLRESWSQSATAARGTETALVRLAVLRLPPQETVFRFSNGHVDSAFAVLLRKRSLVESAHSSPHAVDHRAVRAVRSKISRRNSHHTGNDQRGHNYPFHVWLPPSPRPDTDRKGASLPDGQGASLVKTEHSWKILELRH
jgi:hypothetical protein